MPLQADWFQICEHVMLKALHAKFASYKVLRDLLLSTNLELMILRDELRWESLQEAFSFN